MRRRRIKAPKGCEGFYHCTSKVVGEAFLLGPHEKEEFVRMMWLVADFHGVEILDYTVMTNHYHQFIRVPGFVDLTDKQLLEKLSRYYGDRSREVRDFEDALWSGGKTLEVIRKRYLSRMCDISEFEKIFKQRFSSWYNRRNNRRGTLWMERFNSVLVEDTLEARRIIASYIDLNALRAEIVDDPAKYRFCGYGCALGGDRRCREGIMRVMGVDNWQDAASKYRICIMKRGYREVVGKRGKVSREQLLEVLRKQGSLPFPELMRLRLRYLTEGLVLGSEKFVEEIFQHYRSHFGERRKSGACPITYLRDSNLKILRNLRMGPVS